MTGSAVVTGGGEVKFENAASTNWVYNGETKANDFVIVFTNETASFELPGTSQARILAVGGGGGGGGADWNIDFGTKYGGGGGGGAGGFVELPSALYDGGTYTVSVGAGGAGGKFNGAATHAGENGYPTTVTTNGFPFLKVAGGGGGGGNCDGNSGGSGGGGSMIGTAGTPGKGGTAVEAGAQGHDGGVGDKALMGGGGGGAGAKGADASAGGAGGDGKKSDITGKDEWYAGGGGGDAIDFESATSGGAGGKGGGGTGGYGLDLPPKPGEAGTGGGGGGCCYDSAGGSGGCGVLIVRISAALSGPLDKPTDSACEYNGAGHEIVPNVPFYKINGQNVVTNVGFHSVMVKPVSGVKWTDGTDDEVTVRLMIYAAGSKTGSAEVTGATVSFVGAAETNWVKNAEGGFDLLLKFTEIGTYTLPGSSQARILAVGGGGGGGGADWNIDFGTKYGGGGGGGAGGFVELPSALYDGGTYTVSVGAGGAGGKFNGAATHAGENGQPTTVTTNGFPFLKVAGGGGGGGNCDGNSGGSGGGGSMIGTAGTPGKGGTAVEAGAQGHDGGAGDKALMGGGGGGAGAKGADASAGGAGGDGKKSDITGKDEWYAGGGGGDAIDFESATSGGAGGKGGGGTGGYGLDLPPKPGEAGTGGGGGGCCYESAGGNGGSGIVYVRISSAMNGEFKKPDPLVTTNYDGQAHWSVQPTVFYDVEGDNVGTNVGTYTAWAVLKSGTWPDGTKDKAEVKLVIEKCDATLSDLHLDLNGVRTNGWMYGDADTPDPAVTVEPAWARNVVEYEWKRSGEDAASPWKSWSVEKPTEAGEYEIRARLIDDWNFTCEPVTGTFTVAKREVTFSGLYLRSWMFGTPEEDVPQPSCTVEPKWVAPVYEWRASGTSGEDAASPWKKWSEEQPTEIGEYELRVGAPDEKNYSFTYETVEFSIFGGRGDLYTDYVEIEIAGYTGSNPSVLTNFPYRLTLSETDPTGFLYSRAGPTGTKISFTDSNTNSLPFEIAEWKTNDVSTVYVRIPEIGPKKQIIRLYWNLRPGQVAPPYAPDEVWTDWSREDRDKVAQPVKSITSPVVSDGKFVNYWTQDAIVDPDLWDTGDPEEKWGKIVQKAKLAFGDVECIISNLVSGVTYPTMPTNEFGGSFRVVCIQKDTARWPVREFYPLEQHADFAITSRSPWDDLKGDAKTLTLSGRVMLANDDVVDEKHAVSDQSYWQVREVVTNDTTGATMTNDVFWVHGGEPHDVILPELGTIKCMLPYSSHWLKYMDGDIEKTLWRFNDVIFGNIVPTSGRLYSSMCGLPYSPTQLGISSYENYGKKGVVQESGNIILRNRAGAVVYSPCYTNGIGTIYFDAVNGFNNSKVPESYRIVVEVATRTVDGKIPTDENAFEDEGSVEKELGMIVDWQPVMMVPLRRDGAGQPFVNLSPTNVFTLAIKQDMSFDYFYRFCAKVNCRVPARFRIRRLSADETSGNTADNAGLILVDNIVVSYPQMSADVEPYGKFDRTRGFDRTLGYENAMETPFPAVTDGEIYGRGKVMPFMAEGQKAIVDPREFVVKTKLHYRWSYMDQASNDWDEVTLHPGDGFVSRTPMKLPMREGDIDFWYESWLNVPYYDYFDYSGTGLKLGDLYVESDPVVTNRNANWFFRLRAGVSTAEDFKLIVKTAADGAEETFDMSLISDGTWRGFYPTPAAIPGDDGKGLYVRFEAHNRQTPGSTDFAENVEYWVLGSDLQTLEKPTSIVRVDPADDPSNRWSRVVCDGATGHLLFQAIETTRGATVVHADHQNFNHWNDAHKTNAVGTALFVGTSTATSGVSAASRQIDETFGWWRPSVATNDFWQEFFNVEKEDMQPGGAYEVYQPFSEATSPNGFTIGPGQWVTGAYRDPATGMALQMEGRGKGSFQFVNAVESPRGIEAITFRPRLAQFIEFGDFTYRAGDVLGLTNYTFYCRGAYDVNNRRDFKGNASLSLVAFYKAGEGCYELRVEQDDAIVQHTATGDVINPGNQQRVSLYRWCADDESGEVVATCLGSSVVTNSTTLTTMGEKGNYGLLFISAQNDAAANCTRVCGGLSSGVATVDSTSGTSCRWVSYVDATPGRLQNGSYGVLSANCPGRFRYLYYAKKAQTPTTTTLNTFDAKDQTFNFPSVSDRTSCKTDIQNGGWALQKRRAEKVDESDTTYFGFKGAAVSNEVKVLTAPAGSTAFKTQLTNVWITSFGSVDPVTIPLWSLDECSVKIMPGGTAKSARNDIVLDDIVFTQWRGESYDEGEEYFPESGYASPSNFIFTQAWILTNEETEVISVELNARRSRASVATSIRSPLFDGLDGRGLGLGMFTFAYANAQKNAKLLLQICTNGVDITSLDRISKDADEKGAYWRTEATYDFSTMTDAERAGGTFAHYFGLHGAKGVMRLVVAPATVRAVAGSMDPDSFGSVEITAASCRDEPNLDRSSWWGWNVQTTDDPSRMYLGDVGRGSILPATGMAFALNNSVDPVTGDLSDEQDLYLAHVPFLQTPTFRTETVGEVVFKARKYNLTDPDCRVTVYGARTGLTAQDRDWTPLHYFTVTNDIFETFAYKTAPGERYCAFRFAVTGVKDVDEQMKEPRPQPGDPDPKDDPVRRVLIDEVTVLEAIRARVAFRNVGAFRTDLQGTEVVPFVPCREEQPLCRESWGVQAEIFVPQLPEEVDLSDAKVTLWWFEGTEPWGFTNWRDLPKAKHAELARCADSNLVFRSSYQTAQDAIVPPLNSAGTVQYMLEVEYRTKKGEVAVDPLTADDWPTPSWYNPVDLNRQYGGPNEDFSAYTILDTVAAGWAWINEVNLFGDYVNWDNSDKPLQFVEIAAPNDADLSDWTIRFLDAQWDSHRIVTNEVARFGYALPGLKRNLKGMDPGSKCVFHVLGSPLCKDILKESEGQVDGYWKFQDTQSASDQLNPTGEIASYHPLSIQLVRPSGIIEHEITCIGTNYYRWTDETCDPDLHVDYLNKMEKEAGGQGQFFYAGADEGGREPDASAYTWSRSLGVFAGHGESALVWNNINTMTPGAINGGQTITGTYPQPLGTMVAIYALIDGGHLRQTFGDAVGTTDMVKIFFPKGEEGKAGTNITYEVDNWYDLGPVTQTVNGVSRGLPADGPVSHRYTVNVGAGVSNDVTVTASAVIAADLREKYGLGPGNRYTAAIMDWLEGGSTLRGAFHGDTIGLADFQSWSGSLTNRMSLTEMFWLDMDPTWADHDLVLRAGWSKAPTPVDGTDSDGNRRVAVKMMITNTSDQATAPLAWAPYVLRSADPGVTSWDFANPSAKWAWSNATFKVTGMLINSEDLSGLKDRKNWLPLRWFVFGGGKAGDAVYSTSFDENFESEIDIIDPYSKESPGYNAGWSDYRGIYPVWHMFDLDDRLRPTQVEVLEKTNRY